MSDFDPSRFLIPNEVGFCLLECKAAFEALTAREKQYSHYLAQGSFAGSLVCLFQTSPESPGIFLLFQKLFRHQSVEELQKLATEQGWNDQEYQAFLVYASAFLSNMGNYKSFGDTKFIPNVNPDKVKSLLMSSEAAKKGKATIEDLWSRVGGLMFDLTPCLQKLGFGHKGITSYFSGNCVHADAELAQKFLNSKDLSAYNTRLFKYEENGKSIYEVRLAASQTAQSGDSGLPFGDHEFTDGAVTTNFRVVQGDYAQLMKLVAQNLLKAKDYAANDHERRMLEEYAKSFSSGSIDAHKEGSRHWIKNKGPIIETYIGFIESYRDPYGVRGEFEGFVAMVNKEMSAKFEQLVQKAEDFLPLLPWPAAYEKDTFLKPDFTSLDVLAFGSSGIPAGINIPNYDDIRQEEGFKNVALGNVLSSGYKDTKITFLADSDKELYSRLKGPSFEVQVGLHELLGHGSGKLFYKKEDGTFNFDTENVRHTETGEKISSWYDPADTWNSKFKSISPTYEECRAECVGIYLCLASKILEIFGHHGNDADDIIYINWLNMVRAGLLALEFYSPDTHTWGQAHMQARYVILRVLLCAGEGLVSVEKFIAEDGEPDLIVSLDRSKINSVGKKAIGDFLCLLQVYKATGDYAAGKTLYDFYSAVYDVSDPHFISLREIVLKRKQPRKMFVQCNTTLDGEAVRLHEYSGDTNGMIKSFQERFPEDSAIDAMVLDLWNKDRPHF